MNFKLANLSTINQKYGKTIEQMKDATWEIYANSCGCSGDCGSNWMQSINNERDQKSDNLSSSYQ